MATTSNETTTADSATRLTSVRGDWTAFLVVASAIAVALAASGVPSPLYADYQQAWSFSPVHITLVYATYAAGVIVALLLFGGISDRLGRKGVLLFSLAGLAVSMVLFASSVDLGGLYAARALQGIFTGVLTAAASASLAEVHPRRDLGAASVTNSATTSLAIAAGALFSGAVAESEFNAFQLPYLTIAVLCLLVGAAVVLFVPETVSTSRIRISQVVRVQRLSIPKGMTKEFVLAAACVTAAWSVGGLYLALGGTIAKSLLGIDNRLVTGLVIFAVQGFGALVQIVWTRVLRIRSAHTAAVVACVALATGIMVTAGGAGMGSAGVFFAGALLSGVGFGLAFMAGTRIVSDAAPDTRRGEVLAAYFVVAYAAISLPSVAVGMLTIAVGPMTSFYIFAIAVFVIAVSVLIAILWQRRRRLAS